MPHAQGYGCTIDLADGVLSVFPTNKASRVALLGAEHGDVKALTLTPSDIALIQVKNPTLMTNGRLTIHTHDGKKYLVHFLKKNARDVTVITAGLEAAGVSLA